MANEQNLKPITDSNRARDLQKKSVEKRYENKVRRGLIAEAILNELTDEDLQEIARGIIDRSKKGSNDLTAMRDTIGEKPVDQVNIMNIDKSLEEMEEFFNKKDEQD